MTPPVFHPWLVTLECLGALPGPRFLDGRTANDSLGLAPSTDPPFSGTAWAMFRLDAVNLVMVCLGAEPRGRALVSRPEGPALERAGDSVTPAVTDFAGGGWVSEFSEENDETIVTLRGAHGFLDGRTADGSVGHAPSTDPPFSGTRWRVNSLGRLVNLEFEGESGWVSLDGHTADGTVALADPFDRNPGLTGVLWAMEGQDTAATLRCMGHVEGPRYLDGRTADATVGLAPSTSPPFSGTRWELVTVGGTALRCLGAMPGDDRFLDAHTADGSVHLAPNTAPPFTGTHWALRDAEKVRQWFFFPPD